MHHIDVKEDQNFLDLLQETHSLEPSIKLKKSLTVISTET